MAAASHSLEVSGEVTVTATDLMSAAVLPAILAPLRQDAPGIRVRIVASNDTHNLIQREADIAIRHARPDQPDLIARHVGNFRANLYAASAYLDSAGRPRVPQDVADHTFVGAPDPDRLITALHNMGIPAGRELRDEQQERRGRLGAIEIRVWRRDVPEILCDAEPGIEKVLPSLPSLEFPIWLATHRELQTSRRIRIVFDQLARGLVEVAGKTGDQSASDSIG